MKTHSLLLGALAAAPYAFAHTVFTGFYVNGVPQGDAVAMRMASDPQTCSNPVTDLESKDMACNVGGTKGMSRVQAVPDGAVLSFEIRAWPSDPTKERLDRRHYGPCAVYLKKVDSAIDDQGAGDGWFKIFEEGYDSSSGKWCTDKIIDNNGLLSVAVRKGLQGGYYLARPEIVALHKALNNQPEFYTGCAQVFLNSTGSLVPDSTVSIPGHVKQGEASMNFDIYSQNLAEYTLPGPNVAKLSPGLSIASVESQTEGLKPEGCIVENGEWCGKEIPDYSDEKGCWTSDADCWKQSEDCYAKAPVTGQKGCDVWQAKCTENQNQCKSGNFNGPPNKGMVLTPEGEKIDVGAVIAPEAGNVDSTPETGTTEPTGTTPESSSTTSPAAQTPLTVQAEEGDSAGSPVVDNAVETPKYTTIPSITSEKASAPTNCPCPEGDECEPKTAKREIKRKGLSRRRHGRRS